MREDGNTACYRTDTKVVAWFHDVLLPLLATGFLTVDGLHRWEQLGLKASCLGSMVNQ